MATMMRCADASVLQHLEGSLTSFKHSLFFMFYMRLLSQLPEKFFSFVGIYFFAVGMQYGACFFDAKGHGFYNPSSLGFVKPYALTLWTMIYFDAVFFRYL
jgi:hypothetical protein